MKYTITQPYSPPTHKAIDIALPKKTPLYAPFAGHVYYKYDERSGYHAILYSPDGKERLVFCHLEEPTQINREVRPGEVIAYSGATGNATGAHLHLEYEKFENGQWVSYSPDQFIPTIIYGLTIKPIIPEEPKADIVKQDAIKRHKDSISASIKTYKSVKEKIDKPTAILNQIAEDEYAILATIGVASFLIEQALIYEKYKSSKSTEKQANLHYEAFRNGFFEAAKVLPLDTSKITKEEITKTHWTIHLLTTP